jgi:hypothetical protein
MACFFRHAGGRNQQPVLHVAVCGGCASYLYSASHQYRSTYIQLYSILIVALHVTVIMACASVTHKHLHMKLAAQAGDHDSAVPALPMNRM